MARGTTIAFATAATFLLGALNAAPAAASTNSASEHVDFRHLATNIAAMSPSSSRSLPNGTIVSCRKGENVGQAELRWGFRSSGGRAIDVALVNYKIKAGGSWFGTGDKANVDLGMNTQSSVSFRDYGWRNSPDSMLQDDQWHSMDVAHSGHMQPGTDSRANVSTSFTFDHKGSKDPKCSVEVQLR